MKKTNTFNCNSMPAIFKYGEKIFTTTDYGDSLTKKQELELSIKMLDTERQYLEKKLSKLREDEQEI